MPIQLPTHLQQIPFLSSIQQYQTDGSAMLLFCRPQCIGNKFLHDASDTKNQQITFTLLLHIIFTVSSALRYQGLKVSALNIRRQTVKLHLHRI